MATGSIGVGTAPLTVAERELTFLLLWLSLSLWQSKSLMPYSYSPSRGILYF